MPYFVTLPTCQLTFHYTTPTIIHKFKKKNHTIVNTELHDCVQLNDQSTSLRESYGLSQLQSGSKRGLHLLHNHDRSLFGLEVAEIVTAFKLPAA